MFRGFSRDIIYLNKGRGFRMLSKKIFLSIVFALIFVLTACSTDTGSDEPVEENLQEKTEGQQDKITENENQEESEENDSNVVEETASLSGEPSVIETPALPITFKDAVEYPIVGEFSGDVTYNDDLLNHPELVEVLQKVPAITEDSSEEEIERVKGYIYSLFKENLTMPDASIEQWSSMQINNPEADAEEIQLKENYNVAILLDSSGSMGFMEGNQTRMAWAKQSINDFVSGLPTQANISLQVYGHVGTGSESDKEKSCTNIEEVYPLSTYSKEDFNQALNQFDPAGWTPMAKAIEQAEKNFTEWDGEENTNVIYIVSDGVETCDGDPVRSIESLSQSNINPVINIIGYQVDNDGLEQLQEMAEVSNGRYIHASNQEDLTAEFQNTLDMSKLWAEWHSDSKDIINELHNTIKHQLYDWNNNEKEKTYRQNENLKYALKYLHEEGILDTDNYLDFSKEYRDSYLAIADEQGDIYFELYDINQETYKEKFSEVEDLFRKVRE